MTRWRDVGYPRASGTSSALLRFWFDTPHPGNFRFFFSQREAIESIIYLYEVAEARDKYRLIERFDSGGELTSDAFTENWTRYVVKMATGAGKTKVAALVIVWSYFHKLYEPGSPLSRNFLFIAPNIIVYNRLRKDFEGLRMFHDEPFLPGNDDDRYCNRYWQDDFCPALHLQDNIRAVSATGNIFLTYKIMKTFPQTELDFADAITDGLRRADTVYCPIGELDLCEYLRRYGWVTIKSVFPGDGRHEGRIFLQRGSNFVIPPKSRKRCRRGLSRLRATRATW